MQLDDLTIELIGCRTATQLRRPEAGEFIGLYKATAPNGETGHLYYEYAWDKRDVMDETLHTDNPALVCEVDDSPAVYDAFAVRDDEGEHPNPGDCTIPAVVSPH